MLARAIVWAMALFFLQASFAQKKVEGSSAGLSEAKKMLFATAQPEDITNENFPELIESFDYPNADISQVIRAISDLTGINFIVEPNVKGKITIIAPSQITVAEAYKAFLSALASAQYTVVPSGKFWKIKSSRDAKKDSIETYAGKYFPNTDQMITRIIKLKYISAAQVGKDLNTIPSKSGDMRAYEPTNSLIITDYGSNIARIMKIINELDVPGFEERLSVLQIRHAKAKDIANLIDQIINKGQKGSSRSSRFGASRFSRTSAKATGGAKTGSESFSLVIPDERTNSIIVVGNESGIKKIRKLVAKLDFNISSEDSGGVHVYYVKHGEAESIAKTLNGIAKDAKSSTTKSTPRVPTPSTFRPQTSGGSRSIFGGDVKIAADKQTNSLIITASKQDFVVVKNLLAKIDIARDQVFVKVIIMEMYAEDASTFGIDIYKFKEGTNGIGRAGFRSSESLDSLLSPASDNGLVLGYGSDQLVNIKIGSATFPVPDLSAIINIIKTTTGSNVLSTPQIMALNNEEALIEVGEDIPIDVTQTQSATGSTSGTKRAKATIKLKITPYISPESDIVRMKINQQIKEPGQPVALAEGIQSYKLSERNLETVVTVESNDTVVMGGLLSDKETEIVNKVPILGDIPILGWLFKRKVVKKIKTNLLLFITPKIIRSNTDNQDVLTAKISERIDFIQRSMKGRDPHGSVIDSLPRRATLQDTEASDKEVPAIETF